jgi:hypothetical protein
VEDAATSARTELKQQSTPGHFPIYARAVEAEKTRVRLGLKRSKSTSKESERLLWRNEKTGAAYGTWTQELCAGRCDCRVRPGLCFGRGCSCRYDGVYGHTPVSSLRISSTELGAILPAPLLSIRADTHLRFDCGASNGCVRPCHIGSLLESCAGGIRGFAAFQFLRRY